MPLSLSVHVGSTTPGAITHGSQLIGGETALVGFTAYTDPGLGRKVVQSDLTRQSGFHFISDFVGGATGSGTQTDPYVVTKTDVDSVVWDIPWVTLRACRIREVASANYAGVDQRGAVLDYVTFDPGPSGGTQCMQYQSYRINRCLLQGQTDGAKINGGVDPIVITESIIYSLQQDSGDHNDCLQNVGGEGSVSVQRCLMYQDPVGAPGQGSSAIQSADFASTGNPFYLELLDSYVVTGNNGPPTLRFYDGALRSNITYKATGNIIDRTLNPSGLYLDRGTSNTTPTGQITWSNNVDQSGNPLALV